MRIQDLTPAQLAQLRAGKAVAAHDAARTVTPGATLKPARATIGADAPGATDPSARPASPPSSGEGRPHAPGGGLPPRGTHKASPPPSAVQPMPYRKKPIPQPLRWAVFCRDKFTCQGCQVVGYLLEADHVIPESKGGPTTLDNLQTLCRSCNARKGAR